MTDDAKQSMSDIKASIEALNPAPVAAACDSWVKVHSVWLIGLACVLAGAALGYFLKGHL